MKVEVLIWQRRMERNVTLRDLEKMTGISRAALENYENSRISPRLNQLAVIAEATYKRFVYSKVDVAVS